jgi:hypothetical protein
VIAASKAMNFPPRSWEGTDGASGSCSSRHSDVTSSGTVREK